MPNSTQRWAAGLAGAAKRIAETPHSPLRVIAGPGTGKTFALMRRVMRLLEQGVTPTGILVCSFTRTAAKDLQEEIGRLGVPGAAAVRAGTLHGYCFQLLSAADVLPLTGRVPRPLLRFEERVLMEDLRAPCGEGVRALGKRLIAFSAAWARLQSDTPGWPQDAQDRVLLAELKAWLRFHSAMLIGELVPEALRFLRGNPASPHRPAFEHVLVDEYQDLNKAEQLLLDELSVQGTLTVIGDEDQSIYGFKFAHPQGIAEFDQSHPGTRDESLGKCRRCPQVVMDMANSLIANNPQRAPRVLMPLSSTPPGEVHVVQWQSIVDEANGLSQFIEHRIAASTVEAGRVLVLTPRRKLGHAIRDALNARGVPAHSFFSEEALAGNPRQAGECAAQEAFSLLTLLARPNDRVAMRCWCGFGSPSLRSGAWARLRKECEATGDSPRQLLEQLDAGNLTIPYTAPIVARFQFLQQQLASLQGLEGDDLLDALFPVSEAWTEPIRALATSFADDGQAGDLLELVQRGLVQPELPTDVDYVRVMSLHKSKGLTADLVLVAGCVEGLIPTLPRNASPVDTQAALEEQRRLFFVAITRARQALVLSSVTSLPRADAFKLGAGFVGWGDPVATIASRFMGELGPASPPAVLGATLLGQP